MDTNLIRQSFVLACTYFPSPHNHQTITEFLQLLYSKFGINSKSIVATVTDNGSNFVRAFKIFGRNNEDFIKFLRAEDHEVPNQSIERFEDSDRQAVFSVLNTLYAEPNQGDIDYEADALINLLHSATSQNSQNENQEKSTCDKTGSDELHEFFSSRIKNIEINEEAACTLSNRLSCNAHNLNLIGSSDSLRAHRNKQYSSIYANVFEKLNMLWHYSGLQASSEIIIKHLGKNINKPSKTRWNDIYIKVIFII